MRKIIALVLAGLAFGCSKNKTTGSGSCDMNTILAINKAKVTIGTGIWGDISVFTGTCGPYVDPTFPPITVTPCKQCPLQSKVRIYEYTTVADTYGGDSNWVFNGFSTRLLKEATADELGFYQMELPPGHYTVVAVIGSRLYGYPPHTAGGINDVIVTTGKKVRDIQVPQKFL